MVWDEAVGKLIAFVQQSVRNNYLDFANFSLYSGKWREHLAKSTESRKESLGKTYD